VASASAAEGARGSAATVGGELVSDFEIPARCCCLSRAAGVSSFVESARNAVFCAAELVNNCFEP
jgi:hypothetical protein